MRCIPQESVGLTCVRRSLNHPMWTAAYSIITRSAAIMCGYRGEKLGKAEKDRLWCTGAAERGVGTGRWQTAVNLGGWDGPCARVEAGVNLRDKERQGPLSLKAETGSSHGASVALHFLVLPQTSKTRNATSTLFASLLQGFFLPVEDISKNWACLHPGQAGQATTLTS